MWLNFAVFLSALVVAWITTRQLIPRLRKRGVMDIPNARSSHTVPTPRGGGLGIVAGLAAGIGIAVMVGTSLPHFDFVLGCLIVALAGYLDDRRGGLPISFR